MPAMRLAYWLMVVMVVVGTPAMATAQDGEEDLGAAAETDKDSGSPDPNEEKMKRKGEAKESAPAEPSSNQPGDPDAVAGQDPVIPPPEEPAVVVEPPPPPPQVEPAPAPESTPPVEEAVEERLTLPVTPKSDEGPRIRGGFEGGVAGGKWRQADGAANHIGLALGTFLVIPLTGPLSLQPELLMIEKGADFEVLDMAADEALLYVELVVAARYDLPLSDTLKLFGFAGPGFAYAIDSKRSPKDDLTRFDISLTTGVGVDVDLAKHDILVNLRVDYGFLNQLDRDNGDKARNRTVSLMAGVTL